MEETIKSSLQARLVLRALLLLGCLAESNHQLSETRSVLIAYSRELQCETTAGLYTPYYTVGSDLPLLNQKLQLHYGTQTL